MFLEIILTFSTITLLSIFALKPTLLTIASLVKEIDSKEELVLTMDKKINDLETAQEVMFQNAIKIAELNSALPSTPAVDTLSGQVEGLSASTTLPIDSFGVDETSLKGNSDPKTREKDDVLPEGSDSLNVSLRTSGTFENLISFLEKIEQMRRPIIAESVNMAQSQSTEAGANLVLIISGKVPFVSN